MEAGQEWLSIFSVFLLQVFTISPRNLSLWPFAICIKFIPFHFFVIFDGVANFKEVFKDKIILIKAYLAWQLHFVKASNFTDPATLPKYTGKVTSVGMENIWYKKTNGKYISMKKLAIYWFALRICILSGKVVVYWLSFTNRERIIQVFSRFFLFFFFWKIYERIVAVESQQSALHTSSTGDSELWLVNQTINVWLPANLL